MGLEFTHVVEASGRFKEVFGYEIPELEQSVVAKFIRTEVENQERVIDEALDLLRANVLTGADVLQDALNQMRTIRSGNEERAITTFNSSHAEIKEAIGRASELKAELTAPRLQDLKRAKKALETYWPFLQTDCDFLDGYTESADRLADYVTRETFYRCYADIDQHTRAIEEEYLKRFDEAALMRKNTYCQALDELRGTPGWEQLADEQREQVSARLAELATAEPSVNVAIPQLRSDAEACPARLNAAIMRMMRIFDGERIATVNAAEFFKGGVETEEQLEAALDGLREECEHLIGEGKKVLVR